MCFTATMFYYIKDLFIYYFIDRLIRSKLKPESDVTAGNGNCSSKRCKIWKILVPQNEFKSFGTKKVYKMNF